MRCHICNSQLEPVQVRQDKHGDWMPCHTCVTASWIDDNYSRLSDEDVELFSNDMDAVGLHNNEP
jgi:uncharacterized protein with PIN domain